MQSKVWAKLCGASLICVSALTSASALAQSIDVQQLGNAQAYDVGSLTPEQGGLGQNLWQGTSAERAAALLEKAPSHSQSALAKDLIRAAVLSGGVPPQAGNPASEAAFKKRRFETIVALGEMGAAQDIMSRTPTLSGDNLLKAEMFLRAGNDEQACAAADTVLEDRSAPEWARLRAYCHIVRDEIAAAELTMDVLRGSYKDPSYFSLMNRVSGGVGKPDYTSLSVDDALHVALMTRAGLSWPQKRPQTAAARAALSAVLAPKDRLEALYAAGPALSDAQMQQVLSELAQKETVPQSGDVLAGGAEGEVAAAPVFDLESALSETTARSTAQLYNFVQTATGKDQARALAALLIRADAGGDFERFAALLAPRLQGLSAQDQLGENLKIFIRAAVIRQDLQALRGLYSALNNKPEMQERIALISDALGYGFLGGDLGINLETRLAAEGKVKARAQRDSFIALAMGANLSDIAAPLVEAAQAGDGKAPLPGQLLALQAASRSGAMAETALRAAIILDAGKLDNPGLYAVIKALSEAGLTYYAGRLAAEDILSSFPA